METNPYAPPKASIEDPSATDLKRRSVLLMVVLTLVTFGLYYPIWFLRRRAALNRLDSPRKLRLWPFAVFTAWFAFQFIVGFAAALRAHGQVARGETPLLFNLFQLGINILMLVQSFFTKDILEDHLSGPGDDVPNALFVDSVKLSGVMTFFFQIFYLQYVINRYIAVPKSSPV
jgi:hypothetical protein